jgi:ubiquinone/menaquinone biosynthesis C-methylase UbiE
MTQPRVPETDQGIQGEFAVGVYDRMQRKLRDKGWIETKDVIKSGITNGLALELGPGPGYLGLEWLKNTTGTSLIGLDISADMITVAERNAEEYGLSDRADYVQSSGEMAPFKDEIFDAVFTNGSLHEWSEPEKTFDEIWRVLKKGGKVFISDMRRDMLFLVKWFLWINSKPREMRRGLISSINAAYTPPELRELFNGTKLKGCAISGSPIGVILVSEKK